MKNLVLSMLAMASISVLSSCSSENDVIDEVTGGDQDKVEIKIAAGVLKVDTKAPMENWNGEYAFFANGAETGVYSTTPWKAQIASGGAVTFVNASNQTEKHYYDPDESKNTYLIGYYPEGTYSNGSITYTIPDNGDSDIMISQELSGNKKNPINANSQNFTFKHLLSQLKFIVTAGDGFEDNVKLTKVVLKGTKKSATLNLATNKVSETPELTFTGENGDITAFDKAEGETILKDNTSALVNVMVQPGVTMTLDITTDKTTYSDIPVNITGGGNAAASTAYNITLTFSNKEVAANAEISPWKTGSGSVDVQ